MLEEEEPLQESLPTEEDIDPKLEDVQVDASPFGQIVVTPRGTMLKDFAAAPIETVKEEEDGAGWSAEVTPVQKLPKMSEGVQIISRNEGMPFENLSSIPPKASPNGDDDVAESLSFHMDTSTIKGSQRYTVFEADESPDLGSIGSASGKHSSKNSNFGNAIPTEPSEEVRNFPVAFA